jgi:ATP synthase protein I
MSTAAPLSHATPNPAWMVFRGSAGPAGCSLIVAAVLAAGIGGWQAAVGVAVGGVLATGALAIGPLLMHLGRTRTPVGVMTLAIAGYFVVVGVLGVAYVLVGSASALPGEALGAGVLIAAATWLGGQVLSTRRLRLPVYDLPESGPTDG